MRRDPRTCAGSPKDTQLGVDAHVGTLQAEPLLEDGHYLLEVAALLVDRHELVHLVGVDDDVQRADLGEPELAILDARGIDLLPGAGRVCLPGGVNRRLELPQPDEAGGEPCEVGDGGEHDLGGQVHLLRVAPLGHVLDAADVGGRDELLELRVHAGLCVGVDERRVDVRLLDLLAAHGQVLDQSHRLAGHFGGGDDRDELG
eukprot:scaffold17363_cov102-Isochrysis_galbana.AAC.2